MSDQVPADWVELLSELESRRKVAFALGGPERVAREHKAGRQTARERITSLVDDDSFVEFGTFVTTPMETGPQRCSTIVVGLAMIDGRPVAVGAEDFTVQGGGVGVHLRRYKGSWGGFIEEFAFDNRIPLVLLMQGVGGSVTLQEEKGYPELLGGVPVFPVFDLLSRVPVVAAVLGPTAGSSAARAVISHFSVMTRDNGCLFAGGPPLVKQALGLEVDKMELGGSDIHTKISGLIDNAVDGEADAFSQMRQFLSYLPTNVDRMPPLRSSDDPIDRSCDEILGLISPNARRAFDPIAVVEVVLDVDSFFEMGPEFATSLRTGLGTIGGRVVGVLASDPRTLAGALDADSSEKQTRFVELCDAFHIPIVYFVDVPGFMIGPDAERSGLLRKGARAIQAIHRAAVPVFTVQVRRAFGLAAQATGNLDGRSMRLTWPSGTWGDLPLQGGIESAYRVEIESAADPASKRAEILARYQHQSSPWRTVEKFGVEEMIDPRDTRRILAPLVALYYATAEPKERVGPQVRP